MRFYVRPLGGYLSLEKGQRKETVTWSVYDRLYQCREVACFFEPGGEGRARQHAEKLNREYEGVEGGHVQERV